MKVLIVDDHALFVEALGRLLEDSKIEVAGTARDGFEAIEQVRTLHPDIVLMDIHMPRCNGIEATKQIKSEFPSVKVIMLTMSADDNDLFTSIKNGASGYITKDIKPNKFLELIAGVTRGEAAITHETAARIMNEYMNSERKTSQATNTSASHGKNSKTIPDLSSRQVEILRLIVEGYTYKEIASTLTISERTVNYHLAEMLNRLRLQNRAQLITYATRHGLIGDSGNTGAVTTMR